MARVKRGTKRRARRKKYLKRTKGFFLTKSKLYQSAQEAANRADRYAFRDRRVKKREYRKLWIQRIGAAARLNGLTYGQLIHGLKAAGVTLDRGDFRPHLTLFRIRDLWPPACIEIFNGALRDYKSDPFPVDGVTLFSSELNPKGAIHTPLRTFALA